MSTLVQSLDGVRLIRPKPQQARLDRLVEIVRASPGISIGQIRLEYYGPIRPPGCRDNLASLLGQLCMDRRIQYLDIHRYIVVDPDITPSFSELG